MTEFGPEYNYPTLKGASSKPLLGGENVGPPGDTGANAVFVASQANNLLIPTDEDGLNPVYTNAITEFEIWQGNTLIATKAALNGWTSSVITETDCTIDDATDLEATVTAIAEDEASFVMQFDRVGYNSLLAKVYVKKIRQGITGDQGTTGTTGNTGADGPTGPTGADGTGLVIVKKAIVMAANDDFPSTASNSGGLLFTSPVDHELVLGDTVYHTGFSEGTYNGYFKIVEVGTSKTYRIETITYVSTGGGLATNNSLIRPVANFQPQDLIWYDMIPIGAALMELRLIMITESSAEDELYAYLGYAQSPSSGWNLYMNGNNFSEDGDQQAYPTLLSSYIVQQLHGLIVSPRNDIYLRLTPYIGKVWNSFYTDVKFNLIASYINYNLDTIGS